MLGIIASSAAAQLGEQLGLVPQTLSTPYGDALVRTGTFGGCQVACIARHGEEKAIPPHRVNYRANIWALAELGCTAVLATNAVGSLDPSRPPGTLCIPAQILDFTALRPRTFCEEEMVAIDFTDPYCPRLSATLAGAVSAAGYQASTGLVYACMEGPRFETGAEIKMLGVLGADLVGMTAMPEAALAREKGVCYVSLCVVTNLAAGIQGHHPTGGEVGEEMEKRWQALEAVIKQFAAVYTDDPDCPCHHAIA